MQLQGSEAIASTSAANFEQISTLLEKQIPEQAKNLADNANNLEKVAQYCEDIYVNSKDGDKQHLLNETKSYTTQALASVAYQIHVLANSFLMLLDNQSAILNDMNVSMSHFGHEVDIHKEKVARREIGILTTNKSVVRTVKVKKPEIDEKPVKYVRRPIDYSILDDVGHGVKLARHSDPLAKLGVQTVGRQNSYSSTHSSSAMVAAAANAAAVQANNSSSGPVDGQQTPPMVIKSGQLNGVGTVRAASLMSQQSGGSSGGGHYRAPVAPPSVPSEYLSRQELGIYSSKKELNQSLGESSMLHGAYGSGGMSYRRPSQTSANNMSLNLGGSEYSDTMDRRVASNYMQQFGANPPGGAYTIHGNASMMAGNNGNSSVGYASGKDIGLIRTNLNNIDYATNGTIYRRPQLHPAIYEQRQPSTTSQTGVPPIGQPGGQPYAMRGVSGSGVTSGGLPPPPPPMPAFGADPHANQFHHLPPPSSYLANTHEFDDMDADLESGGRVGDDEDHDVIPNWVPINRCIEKVITTFDYEGQRDDELSFKENMYIYVIKKNDDHWYEGIMKNEMGNIVSGLYPYNYAKCVKRYLDDPRITQC